MMLLLDIYISNAFESLGDSDYSRSSVPFACHKIPLNEVVLQIRPQTLMPRVTAVAQLRSLHIQGP